MRTQVAVIYQFQPDSEAITYTSIYIARFPETGNHSVSAVNQAGTVPQVIAVKLGSLEGKVFSSCAL